MMLCHSWLLYEAFIAIPLCVLGPSVMEMHGLTAVMLDRPKVNWPTPYAVKQHVAANVPTPAPAPPDRHTAAPRDGRWQGYPAQDPAVRRLLIDVRTLTLYPEHGHALPRSNLTWMEARMQRITEQAGD